MDGEQVKYQEDGAVSGGKGWKNKQRERNTYIICCSAEGGRRVAPCRRISERVVGERGEDDSRILSSSR